MEQHNLTYDQQQHVESHAPYLKIFFVLLVLTVLEYFYAKFFAGALVSLVLSLLALAGIKAMLVGLYFMHVKFEGRWVFFMIIPASVLATILILALMPDIGMRSIDSGDFEDEEDIRAVAPLEPAEPSLPGLF